MSITITLTDKLREIPYFSGFQESTVVLQNKPFLQAIVDDTLSPETLSIEDLLQCIETYVYFGMNSTSVTEEVFWKMCETQETFNMWFIQNDVSTNSSNLSQMDIIRAEATWSFVFNISTPVRLELVNFFGTVLNRKQLVRFGSRFLLPSCQEIAAGGNVRLMRWAYERWNVQIDHSNKEDDWLNDDNWFEKEVSRINRLNDQKKYGVEEKKSSDLQLPHVWNRETCAIAARGGTKAHLEMLKYLHENGCPWDEDTCVDAVIGGTEGHLEILKYARTAPSATDPSVIDACPWDLRVTRIAAERGHLMFLKYARTAPGGACPWNQDTCSAAAGYGQLECLRYAHAGCPSETTPLASDGSNVQQGQGWEGGGCPWEENTCLRAIEGGHFECLKYAHENGCPWSQETILWTIKYGRFEMLKYAHAGCLDETTSLASDGSNVQQGQRWKGGGCPWDEITCLVAADYGRLEMLKYAHTCNHVSDSTPEGCGGCPWDERTTSIAANRGHLECLKYAHENGCPLRRDFISTAHPSCIEYIKQNT